MRTTDLPPHFERTGCNADRLYSSKTGRIIPCPNRKSYPRLFCSLLDQHPSPRTLSIDQLFQLYEQQVFNMICSVLQTNDNYAVQHWLTHATEREKSLVLNMLCSVLTCQNVYYGPSQVSSIPRPPMPDGVSCVLNEDGVQNWSEHSLVGDHHARCSNTEKSPRSHRVEHPRGKQCRSCQIDEPIMCSHLAAGDGSGTAHQEEGRTNGNLTNRLNSKKTWKVAESISSSQTENDVS
ncbi:hypothetical protein P879_01855 [Paragonimus westermani]|uniref:Uncharacterized protein n=1 Tax=Paragonimus westermani TaxID=34504 RepID=A0A8T0DM63_9TREM|nr:hypothetical protein P879_01855 [Paragonimus westermani]